MWLPDTNAWIALLNARPSSVKEQFEKRNPSDIYLCEIVLSELYCGAYRSARQEANLALLARIDSTFASVPFDDQAAKICGETRAALMTKGTPIGPYDLQIASIALSRNFIVMTHNIAEFSRVAGLRLEDWEM
ncbi:MAG: type II toxin-antitoxin system VapC family toxin [Betaproteobacteria bacterium]|nr:type II toxin-antitoxin system VapC family toxin [Betaproteobacteria bacterium]